MDDLNAFFLQLNREDFLDSEYRRFADDDAPLPIGCGQTISQPTLVLRMTEELELDKTRRVLEIGTGSGYQTAFLAQFSKSVYTVERLEVLSQKAQERLSGFGFQNICYKIGDGSLGWEEHAPYDRIVVTAAAGRIPEALVDQLANDGKMLVPVGEREIQELIRITKDANGNIHEDTISAVRFVELVGKYGWQ